MECKCEGVVCIQSQATCVARGGEKEYKCEGVVSNVRPTSSHIMIQAWRSSFHLRRGRSEGKTFLATSSRVSQLSPARATALGPTLAKFLFVLSPGLSSPLKAHVIKQVSSCTLLCTLAVYANNNREVGGCSIRFALSHAPNSFGGGSAGLIGSHSHLLLTLGPWSGLLRTLPGLQVLLAR